MRKPLLRFFIVFSLVLLVLTACDHNVYMEEPEKVDGLWKVNGIYFDSLQEAMNYIFNQTKGSKSMDMVPVERRAVLQRDVLHENGETGGGLIVPADFEGQLVIDFNGFTYEFDNSLDHFFDIRGGDEVYIINGTTVIYNEASHIPFALAVNTDTVTIDDHLIDDRRVDNNLIYVGEEGHLKVQNINPQEEQNDFSGRIAVVTDGSNGARLDIEDSSIVIDNVYTMYKNAETGELSDTISEEQTIAEGAKSHININSGDITILAINQKEDYYNKDTGILFDKAVLNILSKEEKETTVRTPHILDETITKSIDEECKEKVEHIILHNMEYHAKVEPTCLKNGRREYWYCNGCEKYFTDEEGTTEINPSDIAISAVGHHSFESTWKADETHHWHECSVCHVHEEDIDHKSEQYIYDENNHWKICDECGTQFAIGGHQWGAWHEHTSGSVTHLIAECTICGATKTATKPEYLLFYIGIGEARLKALEDTPCGDFYINGESLGNNASVQVSNAQVAIEFKPFINSNKNFSPYCYVIHNGSMNQITTGTKDENGNYKVSFTLEDKKEYGVNIQLNTEGGSQSIICYLRLN